MTTEQQSTGFCTFCEPEAPGETYPNAMIRVYWQHNRVERAFNRLKQYRRVATRYEKHGSNYLAMVTLVAILIWL